MPDPALRGVSWRIRRGPGHDRRRVSWHLRKNSYIVVMATWSFYGRSEELGALLKHLRRSRWFFGTIRGRRRIGKTALIQQAIETLSADAPESGPWLLVEVPDSNPGDFATVFRTAVRVAGLQTFLKAPGVVADLPGVAAAVGSLCRAGVTVVFDEFQVCRRGPLAGFPSLLKAQVDLLRDGDPVGGLILLGSVQTEMEALLDDRQAPLFGRRTFDMSLGPWGLSAVLEVAGRHGADSPSRALTLRTLFGGVPKYWRDYAEAGELDQIPSWSEWVREVCQRLFLQVDAPLREEGESLLGHELRRNYLAVLRALARHGPCTHSDLRAVLPRLSLGPYLTTLGRDLRLIEKEQPVFATERQRRARYVVSDPFLLAWLRVLQPAREAARILPATRVAEGLVGRLETLEGHAFERMVTEATEEISRAGRGFTVTDRVRGYWNRPRSADASVELDLVAWNRDDRVVRFGSCKRRAAKHDARSLSRFRTHVEMFVSSTGHRFAGWRQEHVLFSPRFSHEQRTRLEADGWLCRDLIDLGGLLRESDRGEKAPGRTSAKILGED